MIAIIFLSSLLVKFYLFVTFNVSNSTLIYPSPFSTWICIGACSSLKKKNLNPSIFNTVGKVILPNDNYYTITFLSLYKFETCFTCKGILNDLEDKWGRGYFFLHVKGLFSSFIKVASSPLFS